MNYYEVAPTKIFRAGSDILTYEYPQNLPIGTLVTIPLGKKTIPGLITKKTKNPPFPTKPITNTLHTTPLPPHLQKGILWLSTYYATPLPTVLQTALPKGLEKSRRGASGQNLKSSILGSLSERGVHTPTPSRSAVPAPREDGRAHEAPPKNRGVEVLLNPAQKRAILEISNSKSNTILLHGITGSGKTNIYLTLTQKTLEENQSVILLVPEIALTSQLVSNFQKHFQKITILHSKQTEANRHLLWQKILEEKQPQIIIGPRSALFAPVKNLGLIIIDEAHEPTYHQNQSPKYSALRLSSTMSRTILGTATPTIADYYLCSQKQSVVKLTQLAIKSDKTAKIQIIDLKNRQDFKKHRLLSDQLLSSINNSLANKTQTLIFHNRRGTAPLTLCTNCGWQALCNSCLLPLTLHADHFTLLCHTCGQRQKIPTACPICKNTEIIHKGFGTKLLETELSRLFPTAKIARFDADNTDLNPAALYNYVSTQKPDIIIGTQMIAKGFDFPNLTTLGVVQADANLSLPDFSAEERTFQLLTQVIGRANRGHQNTEIFIQTYQPNHPSIHFGAKSDYENLYNHLLLIRKKANLPPFTFLLKLSLTYKTEQATIKNIKKLQKEIGELAIGHFSERQISPVKKANCPNSKNLSERSELFFELDGKRPFLQTRANLGSEKSLMANSQISISSPTPSFHEHTPQGYTWQLTLKSKSRQNLLNLINHLPKNPHLHLTLDPPTLL